MMFPNKPRWRMGQSGNASIEWGILIALIALSLVTVLVIFSPEITKVYQGINNSVASNTNTTKSTTTVSTSESSRYTESNKLVDTQTTLEIIVLTGLISLIFYLFHKLL